MHRFTRDYVIKTHNTKIKRGHLLSPSKKCAAGAQFPLKAWSRSPDHIKYKWISQAWIRQHDIALKMRPIRARAKLHYVVTAKCVSNTKLQSLKPHYTLIVSFKCKCLTQSSNSKGFGDRGLFLAITISRSVPLFASCKRISMRHFVKVFIKGY